MIFYAIGFIVSFILIAHFAIVYPLQILAPLVFLSYMLAGLFLWKIAFPRDPNKTFTAGQIFAPIKLVSTAIPPSIMLLILLGIFPVALVQITFMTLLVINIIEPVVVDIKQKNYLNAIAGILLSLTAPCCLTITWQSPYVLVDAPHMMILWIIAFTLRDWNYISLNYKVEFSMLHSIVLGSPLLYAFLRNDLGFWLLARTEILMISFLIGRKQWILHLRSAMYEKMVEKIKLAKFQYVFLLINVVCLFIFFWSNRGELLFTQWR